MKETTIPTISAIDLFCGAGGLTHGFIQEGIQVRVGYDIDPICKYPYEKNNDGANFVEADVQDLTKHELAVYFPDGDIRVLAGCAPCQPFSTFRHAYDKKKKAEQKNNNLSVLHVDEKWELLNSFARLAQELDPDIITMENVPLLCRHRIFDDFVSALEKKGYFVSHSIVDCAKYGMPQRRKRLVLFASKKGNIEFPDSSLFKDVDNSVRGASERLPPISAGSESHDDPLHKSRNLSEMNLARIIASKQGGTWKDWDKKLLPECYKKKSGETFKAVYGRIKWNDPAPVITTQFHNYGTGRFGHPDQNRALSLREGATLQTFPQDYSFVPAGEPIRFGQIGQLIGNAVPPSLARIIGRCIREHICEHHEKK